MNIHILKVGKVAHEETLTLAETYLGRVRRPWSAKLKIIKDDQLTKETKSLSHYRLGLSEEGKLFSSVAFAKHLQKISENPAVKEITFVIGGPFGLTPEVKKEMNEVFSLSPLTFTSDLALTILSEQLYRAQTILNGQDYHHI